MRRVVFIIGLAICISLLAGSATAYARPLHQPITYYVNDDAVGANDGTSWQNAFTDLQSALDAAVAGDDIWVASGSYVPSARTTASDPRSASFSLKSGVDIYGGFTGDEKLLKQRLSDPGLTVLSGDLGASGHSYRVVRAGEVTSAVLDGFTITGGRADASSARTGGGMYSYKSVLTVSDCVFSDNLALDAGGGMCNSQSALTVTDCLFVGNQSGSSSYYWGRGGGMCNQDEYGPDSHTVVTRCVFRDNDAYTGSSGSRTGGGGMYNSEASPVIEGCTFQGNWGRIGGGMYNFASAPSVTGCLFKENEGYQGAGIFSEGSSPTIMSCIFNGNCASDSGGGIYLYRSQVTIWNTTFYKNGVPGATRYTQPTWRGGAIFMYLGASCTFANVIFESNATRYGGGAIWNSGDMRPTTVENCLFHGNTCQEAPAYGDFFGQTVDGTNVIGVDPLFVDAEGGDFRLAHDSPCIDAGYYGRHGNYTWTPLPATDFYGDKRLRDGDGDGAPMVDIGAAEYVPNLPDLGAFLQGLVDTGEIGETLAARLLAYVDAAQAALAQDESQAATSILNELIADVKASLGDIETAQLIERKTEAVIECL